MEIILHLPQTPKGRSELAESLALFHAEHAQVMLQRLSCPIEQKMELVDTVVRRIRAAAKAAEKSNRS